MAVRNALWKNFEEFPPAYIRIIGRLGQGRGSRGLTTEEVIERSGLAPERVRQIELMTDWKGVDLLEAEAFCRGCRFDPSCAGDRRRHRMYENICQKRNQTPGRYLKMSSNWNQFQELIGRLRSSGRYATK